MDIKDYEQELRHRELTKNTKASYLRAVKDLLKYAGSEEINKDLLINYKEELLKKYKTSTVNTKITIINNFLDFKATDLSIKQESIQSSTSLDNVLTEEEFQRLLNFTTNYAERPSANRRKSRENIKRTRAIMLVLRYTGIRVSELEYLTVEAVRNKEIDVYNKGKHRKVAISKSLEKELKQYIKETNIKSGAIITNRNGDPLSRSYIFKDLKFLGGQARIKKDKIYPHSFRHLFAKEYIKNSNNNPLNLAKILGHSSLETTRLYTEATTDELRDTME